LPTGFEEPQKTLARESKMKPSLLSIGRGRTPSSNDHRSRFAAADGCRCGKFEPGPSTRPPQHPQRPPHPGTKSLIPPPPAGSEEDPRPNWPPPSLAGGKLLYRGRHELKLQLGLQIRRPPTPQARRRHRSKRRRGEKEPGGPYSTIAAPPPPCKRRRDTKSYT